MQKEEWDEDEQAGRSDEDETVNQARALWARPKSEITDEQYKEFYKHVSHDIEAPLAWTHNRGRGPQEYTQLLYIPAHAPFDLWDREHAARHQAVRAARLHHGRRRAAAAGVPALRARRGRLGRPAAQRLARDPAGEPRRRGDPRRLHQARARPAGGPGRERQGEVRDVLEGVRQRAQGRHRRGLRQPRAHRQAAALRVDARPTADDAERVARRLRRRA